jgi:endonuclease G
MPLSGKRNTTLRCTDGYALLHDNDAKIAQWAAWTVTPDESLGCVPRDDAFVADTAIPKGLRSEPDDYVKSGYDKGHIVPNADLSWSKQTMYESFLMSNMSPQLPSLNRGAWKYLETTERTWAWARNHSITIYAGNIWGSGAKTIGANKVVVPQSLYKILIDDVTGESIAFVFPQTDSKEIDLKARLTSIAQIEALTGVTFPVPPGTDKSVTASAVWPADQGDSAAAKKAVCKVKR